MLHLIKSAKILAPQLGIKNMLFHRRAFTMPFVGHSDPKPYKAAPYPQLFVILGICNTLQVNSGNAEHNPKLKNIQWNRPIRPFKV